MSLKTDKWPSKNYNGESTVQSFYSGKMKKALESYKTQNETEAEIFPPIRYEIKRGV